MRSMKFKRINYMTKKLLCRRFLVKILRKKNDDRQREIRKVGLGELSDIIVCMALNLRPGVLGHQESLSGLSFCACPVSLQGSSYLKEMVSG